MKRDMDLVREILLAIEEKHTGEAIFNLQIPEHNSNEIAFHCRLLYDAGLISQYKEKWADNRISIFAVGGLTWEGYDYLDKVRDNSVWKKTKDVIKEKGLPLIFDTIKTIASALITATAEGVANSIIKNGGQV